MPIPESLRLEPAPPAPVVLGGQMERAWSAKPLVMVRLRDGRTHRVALSNTEWAHDGSSRDILAYEEPIKEA